MWCGTEKYYDKELRIISGTYKSRKIFSPNSEKGDKGSIRPTSDRARETIFDILVNRIDFDGINCLDLFAGTGAFGFESISRGAGYCTFVDVYAKSTALIDKTAQQLGTEEKIVIQKNDSIRYLKENGDYFEIIFADPPYGYENYEKLVNQIFSKAFEYFILETASNYTTEYDIKKFDLTEKKIGNSYFYIFRTIK